MEPDTRDEFDKVWAIIRAATTRANEMERRELERYQQAMARMDRVEARTDRMEAKFQRNIEGMRKMILAGMKLLAQVQETQKENAIQIKALTADTKALQATQKALLQSFRNGGNGHGGRKR